MDITCISGVSGNYVTCNGEDVVLIFKANKAMG